MATAGPPPGLGAAAPPAAALPPNPFGYNGNRSSISPAIQHAGAQSNKPYHRPTNCPRMYHRGFLLALSSSALVAKPVTMGRLTDWYGEWEPYHHKSNYNYRDSARRAHVEESTPQAEGEDASNNSGFIGGALGAFGPRREGAGARFGSRRNEDRERGESLRLGEVSGRRAAPAGKNPFGQISASGTFKPAGTGGLGRGGPRDPTMEGSGENRRFGMGERATSYGKDRMREVLPDDRRGPRDRFGDGRDQGRERRRGERGFEGDESREEGESIDSPRIRRTGGADMAADWRKPGEKDRGGPFSNVAGDRARPGERRGPGGGRSSGPAWMGDGDENPAWMEDDSEGLPVDNRAPFGQFGSRRLEADDMDANRDNSDTAGAIDSIQAFKAQMKERERRERLARGEPEPTDHNVNLSSRPPPGLGRDTSNEHLMSGEKSSHESEMDAIRKEMIAAANQRSTSGGSMFDSISNSHAGPASEGQAPPGLPGRSSRFARFFDGRGAAPRDPQAAALAAQQKMLESMGGYGSGTSSASPAANQETEKESSAVQSPSSQPASTPSSSINISELFSKASVRDKGDSNPVDKSGKNVTEADQQSMQKLMAMLQGGGKPPASQSGDGRDSATPTSNQPPRPDSVNRLRELLGGHIGNESSEQHSRQQALASPGPAGEASSMDGHSPSPYHQQQHQRAESVSSPQDHQQRSQSQGQMQQRQQAQHSQYLPYLSQSQPQQPQRSESPGMPYGQQFPAGPGLPNGPGGPGPFAGFPGNRPPPGMDPHMMARPPPMGGPGFQQLPPHVAAALGLGRGPGGPVPPPGMAPGAMPPMPRGPNGQPSPGPFPGFGLGAGPFPGSGSGRPPMPPGMPPQLYQQLMSMPPHIQQQVLAGQGFPPAGMGGPPRSPYDMSGGGGGGGNGAGGGNGSGGDRRPHSPANPNPGSMPPMNHQFPPYYAQGPGMQSPNSPPLASPSSPPTVGSQAMNGANLMALLSGGRNTPTNH